ncbi:leukocyte elastase inhibitor [Rhipicephalus sanguineus]|uniref:leukocyte elastase inhibitor n=1 Tax=Rhipicephalus sanguineus TaxID=34632 RepID=UPI0020C37EB5|nr:leukocyte elastase inhibitor [Rhipicephalus sanguineus]
MERDLVTNETALRELLQRAVAALDDAGQQPSLLQPCRGSSEEALANPPPVLTVQIVPKSVADRRSASTMWRLRRRARRSGGHPVLQNFSLQLYRALSRERLNVFVSPFGTAVALVTALAGSRGDTAEQILAALGATHEEELLHEFGIVGRVLEPLSPLHVGLASKMYLSTSLELADSFKEAIHQEFGGQVNLSTRVLMVGTSFMRCLWLDKFSELYTAPMPFFADDGKLSVPTMCSRRICNYCHVERLACRVLELPCMMEHLQLLILLSCSTSTSTWRATLAAVGIRDLFDKEEADLTGISDEKELCVHDFLCRSRFEVTDEDPVRLDIGGSNSLKLAERTDLPSFEVNRPFMFLVVERQRKAILYIGCLRNPNVT